MWFCISCNLNQLLELCTYVTDRSLQSRASWHTFSVCSSSAFMSTGHTPPAVQPQQPHTSEEQGDCRRAVCPSSADYSSYGAASVNPAHPQGAAQPQISSAREAPTREQPIVVFRFPVQETHGVLQTERGKNMESASISPDCAQFQWSEDGLEITQSPPVMESVGDGSPSGPRSPDPSQSPDWSVAPQYEFAEGGLWLSGAAPVAEQGDAARSNMASNDVDLSTGNATCFSSTHFREIVHFCISITGNATCVSSTHFREIVHFCISITGNATCFSSTHFREIVHFCISITGNATCFSLPHVREIVHFCISITCLEIVVPVQSNQTSGFIL